MRTTLHTHNEWFKLQMCKDRFEGLLKIDLLKEVNSSLLADNLSKSSGDISNRSSSQGTATSSSRMPEDGSSPAQVSSTADVASDETAILKVMVSPNHFITICKIFPDLGPQKTLYG